MGFTIIGECLLAFACGLIFVLGESEGVENPIDKIIDRL